MSYEPNRGFRAVLSNRPFRALWMAQLFAQTAQHAIHFIQMVLIEQLTGSAVQLGIVILAFTLPGVLFSPVAGVVTDRFPKKWVLVTSNLVRVLLAISYIPVLILLGGVWQLLAIYAITFLTATLAQFFYPAEAATIPLLVGEDRLLAANSLFTLTMAISQVIGLLILGPLAVSLVRVEGGFLIITALYLGATVLVARLPRDPMPPPATVSQASRWQQFRAEFGEGWQFVSGQHRIKIAMIHLVTIATLVMTIAMLAPGYAARVLGMGAEKSVILFAPAGIGMLLAAGLVGRWGYLLRRINFESIGLMLAGVGFGGIGLLGLDYHRLLQPILHVYPDAAIGMSGATMVLGFVLGICMSSVNILAQTVVQQESPPFIRGRVFAVQFMLSNLVGIPPMLALGGVADAVGIPRVLLGVGVITVLIALASAILVHKRSPALPT